MEYVKLLGGIVSLLVGVLTIIEKIKNLQVDGTRRTRRSRRRRSVDAPLPIGPMIGAVLIVLGGGLIMWFLASPS
jgi:hypothetical protein